MKFYNYPNTIAAGTVMNATINSKPMQLLDTIGFSYQIVFTGTPTGSFKLQASVDPVNPNGLNPIAPTNWSDIANSTFTVTAAGNVMWDYDQPNFTWVRAVYTDTSGGTSTATITSSTLNAKGF